MNNERVKSHWLFVLRFWLVFIFQFSVLNSSAQSLAYKAVLEGMYKKTVPLISCEELKKNPNVVLLDTRSKREYQVSHIRNARWVGYEEFKLKSVKDLPKNTPIVVYCSVGYRSERIGEQFQKAGYTQVRNLYGSLFEWVNQGNELLDAQEKPTNKIHAYDRTWGVWLKRGEKVYE